MKKCKTLDLNPFSVATGQNSVVLSKFNADEDGVKYVPWKSAKPGNWALTDDDFVALCVKRQSYTDKRNRQRDLITLSFATLNKLGKLAELYFTSNFVRSKVILPTASAFAGLD